MKKRNILALNALVKRGSLSAIGEELGVGKESVIYEGLRDGVWDIFNASKDSGAWYYTSMLDAFGNGDEGIRDMPAFKEFEKCVGEIFGDVKV